MGDELIVSGVEFNVNVMAGDGDNKTRVNLNSSTNLDQETDIEVCDICIVPESSTHLTVTTVLLYCKQKILNPYLRLLSFMGLRSLLNERESSFFLKVFNYFYTATAILFMIIGYILQYMSCFRRDRGFWYVITSDTRYTKTSVNAIFLETCEGSLIFTFVIPSILHFAAYLHAIYVFRSGDDEQLPVLMERVFLITTNLSSSFITQKKLVRTLWFYIIFSVLWMISCFAVVNFMMTVGNINFKWLEDDTTGSWGVWLMKILLVMCTLAHDMVQATIISNYCLQAELLTNYALFLKEKLLQQSVVPLEWMREIEDFKKLLDYFNGKVAHSVCILTIINISFSCSGLLWITNLDHIDRETLSGFSFSILNIALWCFIAVSPFIQAARLSHACQKLKTSGQEARTRPYVHLDTPTIELDSILLYTTSLSISGKLYFTSITGRRICLYMTIVAIILLVLGQCHYLVFK
ncbi:unnamed protein product [Acanthoscelides obtectus]|uniref:Uncharacterized protein n=1 Tax=Acanthoscelides obtectus TaxID=200917 RepID=A0A9P0KFU7_ACAOB|nr:unnamed protein product [Acanthoscelides obtectus]CAK1666661.1 hypothetical protein AOBTE_LOCUS25424 [Acanthoscelides obtectus]